MLTDWCVAHCRMYLDGQLAGQIATGQTYVGSDGVQKDVQGGRPMYLDRPLQLCNNEDDDPRRHFFGWIAYLGKPHSLP